MFSYELCANDITDLIRIIIKKIFFKKEFFTNNNTFFCHNDSTADHPREHSEIVAGTFKYNSRL